MMARAALLVLVLAGCAPGAGAPGPCSGAVVMVTGTALSPCNLTPPQRLDADLAGLDPRFAVTFCADTGGVLIGTTCQGQDY